MADVKKRKSTPAKKGLSIILPGDKMPKARIDFAEYVLRGMHPNEAYLKAGYQAKTLNSLRANSSDLLHEKDVAEYIEIRRAEIIAREQKATNIDRAAWLAELRMVGFSKITDYLSFGEHGVVMKDSDQIDEKLIGAIKEVKSVTTSVVGDDEKGTPEVVRVQTEFKMHEKVRALMEYGVARGFVQKNENTPSSPSVNIQVNVNVIGGK